MSNYENVLSNLSYDAVDVTARRVDWSQALGENCEGWRSFDAVECDECGRVHVLGCHGETSCSDECPEFEDDEGNEIENICNGSLISEGPMMDWFYSCQLDDCEEAAKAIAGLPLCVVEFEDGETGFALTGGGMDLSWEICEAFIRCGYLPPFVYASDLPDMAGKHRDPSAGLVLAAAMKTCEGLRKRAARAVERVEWMAAAFAVRCVGDE